MTGAGPVGQVDALTARPTRERVLRRFAGAGAAVLVAGALLGWTWLAYLVLVGALVTYVVGIPLSLWLERRSLDGPGVLWRHLVAGLWAGGLVGFAFYPPGFLLTATIGAGIGAAAALVAAAAGTELPRRALWPAVLVGPLVLAALAWSVWLQETRLAAAAGVVPTLGP